MFENEFSWSFSRHRIFSTCRRKYYFNYYGSWGGWEKDSPPETKKAYILKKITTLPMLVGDVVHQTINICLESLHKGREIAPEKAEKIVIDLFKQSWRQSKNKDWWDQPSRSANLFEHYYQQDISDGILLQIRDVMVDSIQGFYQSDSYSFIKFISGSHWLTKEELTTLNFDKYRIWVKLDFAVRHDDRIYIYDWKTGKQIRENETQMAIYALYAMHQWNISLENLRLFDIYLQPQLPVKIKVSENIISNAKKMIWESINAMVECLEDESANIARLDRFHKIDNINICRRCQFKELCFEEIPV